MRFETKTDNFNLDSKLNLRRHFLAKYGVDGAERPRVLDCCQGDGILWERLRSEFDIETYWGLDVKVKPGRIKIRSERVLAQHGWRENVIDIDTYGSPWKHWTAMLPNVSRPTTVFLTIGLTGPGGGRLGRLELDAIGLTIPRVIDMASITHRLARLSATACIAQASSHGLAIIEALESPPGRNARYLGLRLEPRSAT